MTQRTLNLRVKGLTVRLTVVANRRRTARTITISRAWHRDETIEIQPGDDLDGIWRNGEWDLEKVYDLVEPAALALASV